MSIRPAFAAAVCTVLLISSDAETRRRWSDALSGEGRNVVVLGPGVDALLTATTQLDAIDSSPLELSGWAISGPQARLTFLARRA